MPRVEEMTGKDYYKILEVSPNATSVDIKKSYRRLALRYHPDKNFGNALYEAKFKEIHEAYRVLTDLKQRQEYNYQRSRQAYTEKKKPPPVTPQSILAQTIDFRKKISTLDPDRMNKLALYQQIQHLLARSNIQVLQQCNDPKLSKRVVEEVFFCCRYLPFPHVERICFQLTALAGTDNMMYRRIYNYSKEARLRSYWEKYKLLAALVIAVFICLAIYFISNAFEPIIN